MAVDMHDMGYDWGEKYDVPLVKPGNRIIVHRTANPNAGARQVAAWFWNEFKASCQYIVDQKEIVKCVDPKWHAYHVKEARKAKELGFKDKLNGWPRGDVGAIGIEMVERKVRGKLCIPDKTKEKVVALIRDMLRYPEAYNLDPNEKIHILGHSELDPWNRNRDPDELWDPDDIRAAVGDVQRKPLAPAVAVPEGVDGFTGTLTYLNGMLVRVDDG